ncbi:MAG TPA: M28 family peptidase [Blastocatellia bacterium]|nr:M28 family peptidase [Blastocatellia bacterium]
MENLNNVRIRKRSRLLVTAACALGVLWTVHPGAVITHLLGSPRTSAAGLPSRLADPRELFPRQSEFPAGVPGSHSGVRASAERIARHIAYLASDELQGRRAGTPGADKAASYIAAEFKNDGLTPAAPSGFLEPFGFVSRVELGRGNRFVIRLGADSKTIALKDDWMPLAFSSPASVSSDVVFAGYGISAPELKYDNYSGLDITGKTVMILRGGPDGDNPHGRFADYTMPGREIQFKTLKAREKGARGVVFLSTTPAFADDSLSRLPFDLNFLDGGIAAAALSRTEAEALFIRSGLKLADVINKLNIDPHCPSLSGVEIDFKTHVDKITSQSSNVVGMIEGSDPVLRSQYIVIGAHYDHLGLGGPESLEANPYGKIHHGADDNASGDGVLLELARALSAERSSLRRSIIFAAFSGEEEGLLGSGAYTKSPPIALTSTEAMINMDMVGRLRERHLIIGGVATSPAWKPLLQSLNDEAGAKADGVQAVDRRFTLVLQDDGYGPSDHQSFYVHDVPVLFFFTGSQDDYHKASDTADKINNEGARQIAEFVAKLTLSIANRPDRIAFNRVKRETKPASGGFRVYLGTVPNYSEQTEGLKLDGIRPGSPAERAGLLAGDIVVKLGTLAVKNIYDYTYALEELRAGEETEIVVRRAEKLVKLTIVPEKRN